MEKLCLAIESTAHTFSCAIVSFTGKIFSNERAVYTTETGGMNPTDVKEHHLKNADQIIEAALKKAKVNLKNISLVSFAHGPGISPMLLVGRDKARELAKKYNSPLVGVNHCVAHLTIGNLTTGLKDPVYLYVSGVNTQVIALESGFFRVFGETLDVGLGNALDKFGRTAGLGFPAGSKIEQLAKKGKYVELPYTVKGMDVSFSGLVTRAAQLLKKKVSVEDICFSFQETCFAMLAEISERALAYTGKKELLLIGGVAANKRLAEMLDVMCKERSAVFKAVPLEYSGDQAAMIGWQGILEYTNGKSVKPDNADILPYERTDEVAVIWS